MKPQEISQHMYQVARAAKTFITWRPNHSTIVPGDLGRLGPDSESFQLLAKWERETLEDIRAINKYLGTHDIEREEFPGWKALLRSKAKMVVRIRERRDDIRAMFGAQQNLTDRVQYYADRYPPDGEEAPF